MFRLSLISSAGAWLALLRDGEAGPKAYSDQMNVTRTLVGDDVIYDRMPPSADAAQMNIGLRCCSGLNGTSCTSWMKLEDWDRKYICNFDANAAKGTVSFSEAQKFCRSVGQYLCSETMLRAAQTGCANTSNTNFTCTGGCRNSGCTHNNRFMWAKDSE